MHSLYLYPMKSIFILIIYASLIEGGQKICTGEIAENLTKIRTLMKDSNKLGIEGTLQAYIVPMTDAHQSEFIGERDKRIQYINGFTGSAGEAIITENEAIFWTDSRYHLQAEEQLDLSCWTVMKKGQPEVPDQKEWLNKNLEKNSSVGVDSFLITLKSFEDLEQSLKRNGHLLIDVLENLVDSIWTKPSAAENSIYPLDIKFSGKTSKEKIDDVLDELKKNGAESILISSLDDIAWLLNLRGCDISYNPFFYSYIILSSEHLYFFVDQQKVDDKVHKHLNNEKANVVFQEYEKILDGCFHLVNTTVGNIILSTDVSRALAKIIPTNRRIFENVLAKMKTVKNSIEADNMVKAHIRDGVALIRYLSWLNSSIDTENITELSGANKLSQFRREQKYFKDLSFEVISAVGKHAAMVHYSPTFQTSVPITRKELYMVDSGAQYLDGTTDVTRTVHFGLPKEEEIKCYTLVLKGFIALATSVFPKNTQLSYLDHVARRPLWQYGLDYGHGTGHGVGMFLSVHEYPPLIHGRATDTFDKANIFTSNEPGFYKDNEFGIRIEDVIQLIKYEKETAFGGRGGLTFKSITFAPLQTKLINVSLLNNDEITFISEYNHRVFTTISPILLKHKWMDSYNWLRRETRPLQI